MERFVFVNDSLVPEGQASLLISDLAIQRGYGIFDFFRTRDGAPVYLEDHLDRFFHSAARMRLELGRSREELRGMIAVLLERNGIADSGVRLTLTGGYSEDGYSIGRANLVIRQLPHAALAALDADADRAPDRGMRLLSYPHMRQLPEVKTIDYLMAIWLQPVLREKGVDEVLYHRNGIIAECPRANFFLVTGDGALVTPGRDVLKGITRMKVIGLTMVEERDVRLEEIRGAKEAFITSTTKQVMPVVEVDGVPVGDGKAGPVARWVSEELYRLAAAPLAPPQSIFY